jgi:hypothetical protein
LSCRMPRGSLYTRYLRSGSSENQVPGILRPSENAAQRQQCLSRLPQGIALGQPVSKSRLIGNPLLS